MARIWKKDPSDTEAFTITWYGTDTTVDYALDVTESITASIWILAAPLVEVSESFDATTATIFISGGLADVTYEVTNEVTVDSGRILNRSVPLKIEELFAT